MDKIHTKTANHYLDRLKNHLLNILKKEEIKDLEFRFKIRDEVAEIFRDFLANQDIKENDDLYYLFIRILEYLDGVAENIRTSELVNLYNELVYNNRDK